MWFFYSQMHVCVSVWESGLLFGSGRVVKLKLSVQNWVVITVAVHFRSATLTPNQCCFSTLSINAHVITTMNNRLWKASETRWEGGRGAAGRGQARRLTHHLQHLIRCGTRGLPWDERSRVYQSSERDFGWEPRGKCTTHESGRNRNSWGNLLENTAHGICMCVCVCCGEQMGRAPRSLVHYLRACLQTTTMQPALITCNQTWQLIWVANVCLGLSAHHALTCVCGNQHRCHQTPAASVRLQIHFNNR